MQNKQPKQNIDSFAKEIVRQFNQNDINQFSRINWIAQFADKNNLFHSYSDLLDLLDSVENFVNLAKHPKQSKQSNHNKAD